MRERVKLAKEFLERKHIKPTHIKMEPKDIPLEDLRTFWKKVDLRKRYEEKLDTLVLSKYLKQLFKEKNKD